MSGIGAPDVFLMRKSLRLAWLARIMTSKASNFVVHDYLEKYGGIKLLIQSHYDNKALDLPMCYQMFEYIILKFER